MPINKQILDLEDFSDVESVLEKLGIDPDKFKQKLFSHGYSMDEFLMGTVPTTTIKTILQEFDFEYVDSCSDYDWDDVGDYDFSDLNFNICGEELNISIISTVYRNLLNKYYYWGYNEIQINYLVNNVPEDELKKAIVDVKNDCKRVIKNYDKNWAKQLCYLLNSDEISLLFYNLFNKKVDGKYSKFDQVQYLVANVPKDKLLFIIEFVKTKNMEIIIKNYDFALKLNELLTNESLIILFENLLNKDLLNILTDEINIYSDLDKYYGLEENFGKFDKLRQVRYLIDSVPKSEIELQITNLKKNSVNLLNNVCIDEITHKISEHDLFNCMLNAILSWDDLKLIYDAFLCKKFDFNKDKNSQIEYLLNYAPKKGIITFMNDSMSFDIDATNLYS